MQFFQNRYTQLVILTLGLGLLFWALFWLILTLVGIREFPIFLQLAVSFLGAGVVIAKVFSNRIF